jgi:hypothetical protein
MLVGYVIVKALKCELVLIETEWLETASTLDLPGIFHGTKQYF